MNDAIEVDPPREDAGSGPTGPHGGDEHTARPRAAEKVELGEFEPADSLDHFGKLLRSQADVDVVLQRVCEQVTETIADADMAGVTLLRDGLEHPETAALTDVRVFDVDLDQYRANEGPCLEAARTRSIIRVRVREVGERWPVFATKVAGLGVGSYLSAPLSIDDQHLGALNIYSFDDHGFDHVDEVVVRVFVAAVEAAVWNSRRARLAQTEVDGLQEAMKTRSFIDQAKGIIMAARGISAEEAFSVLSEQSQNTNVKVADIARNLIDSVAGDRP
ncbi:GAF and ANTAR domain-containing protein [Rhodococcus fascians]|nr:GAF and ANTAR domain-containing protein [Rhodococcus fascians]MBY4238680.1 GAF and ANTAR domain-containing protein [Rhodococcus fascians]MBY4254731.1 GAF and ANTAR domain-containing protein [Rhodococcus fascians]MBY4270035.1 GAF and ANTAR domain-containing protein [Rhodococcus fascians]